MACQTLTPSQIRQYAQNAGFSGSGLDTIVAIAQAESGGYTCAVNTNDPNGGSYGLVQINGAHFQSGSTTQACALDPQCAMKFAYQLSGGSNFIPWGSYTNSSYKQFLGNGGTTTDSSSNNSGGSSPLDAVGLGWVNTLTSSSTWIHVGVFLVALVFVIIGFAILVSGGEQK